MCVTLMKFNAKTKSFHVAVRGNFPTARDSAEPDTYTTTRRRAVGNRSSSESSSKQSSLQSSNDQRTIHRSPRHRVDDHPPTSDPTSDPTGDPTGDPTNDAANEPQQHSQAVGPPPGSRRTNRRNDTHKSLVRRRAYAAIRASHRAAPGLASNEPPRYLQSSGICRTCALKRDTPKRRKRDDSRSGKET